MQFVQTPTFIRQTKKLYNNQQIDLKKALKKIIENPLIGEKKKGDLTQVQVYKFSMVNQLTLLAYKVDEDEQEIILLSLGSHENFYRDLKK